MSGTYFKSEILDRYSDDGLFFEWHESKPDEVIIVLPTEKSLTVNVVELLILASTLNTLKESV